MNGKPRRFCLKAVSPDQVRGNGSSQEIDRGS
jgi:hypothetical protein